MVQALLLYPLFYLYHSLKRLNREREKHAAGTESRKVNPGLSGPKARVLPRKSVMPEPRAAEIGSSSVIPALEVFTRGWGSRRNEQPHSKKTLAKIWSQLPALKRTQDSSTRRKNCKTSISL